jgi:hypothetical protein
MSAEIVNVSSGLVTVKISGLVTFDEFTALQQAGSEHIRQHSGSGKVCVLGILEDFRGWAREGDWGDTTWLDAHDPFIARIAIVGDKRWELSALGFSLEGLRKAEVKYFVPADVEKARAWLAAANQRAASS